MAYFLIAVATKRNLQLCTEWKMAGFTSSVNGYWAFVDIDRGDYVSFLHGARVYNLYRVARKIALENAEHIGPWEPIHFGSGKVYHFPFRLLLRPVRGFEESMIRPEFLYIAENLLLRGGYRKTHFQADEITLYNVSQMGIPSKGEPPKIAGWAEFTPKIALNPKSVKPPMVYPFNEAILQSLVRKSLEGSAFLGELLESFEVSGKPGDFEILGEKALSTGHVDLLIKPRHPVGFSPKIVVEVKKASAGNREAEQLKGYISELGDECVGGVLVAESFRRNLKIDDSIKLVRYSLKNISSDDLYTPEELMENLKFELIS